jgi:signal transduction histidine kinase
MKLFQQKNLWILCLLIIANFAKVTAQITRIDSAKNNFTLQQKNEDGYLRTAFFIADEYMNVEQYDSAQIWLNKIYEKLPAKKASLFNYFLITRQAEVYYYNDLQQLGLQESFRGLQMAQDLNDSLLLADSYNFLGLFYMNLDSAKAAIPFYKDGLLYTKQPPYPPNYLSLTKPHHLYGNMSEAYYKLGIYDSALTNIFLSLQKAYQINWGRGIAVGHNSAGDIFLALHKYDSALFHYQKSKIAAQQSKDIDVELICHGGIAKAFNELGDYAKAIQQLNEGFTILKNNPNLNRYYSLQFLTSAITIYKNKNDNASLATTLEIKSNIEAENLKNNNTQLKTILKAGVANEKRLLSLEVTEAKQKQKLANTRLVIVLIAFALLALSFILYRYLQNQKLAAAKLRQKISQDLHDDIGASLSSLQIYGSIAEKNVTTNPLKTIEMVQKISVQSKLLMENMNDIVWSMKTAVDSSTTLEAKIKNFGSELLNDKEINFTYTIDNEIEKLLNNIHARKNILLLIKEAMNNIAKYSQATVAGLILAIKEDNVHLTINDNGVGFDVKKATNGNGLKNMQYRINELKGTINFLSEIKSGTSVKATIPLKAL